MVSLPAGPGKASMRPCPSRLTGIFHGHFNFTDDVKIFVEFMGILVLPFFIFGMKPLELQVFRNVPKSLGIWKLSGCGQPGGTCTTWI